MMTMIVGGTDQEAAVPGDQEVAHLDEGGPTVDPEVDLMTEGGAHRLDDHARTAAPHPGDIPQGDGVGVKLGDNGSQLHWIIVNLTEHCEERAVGTGRSISHDIICCLVYFISLCCIHIVRYQPN